MKTSTKGLMQIAKLEGCCTGIYYDSDKPPVLTYGIGCTSTELPNIKQLPLTTKFTIQQCFDDFKKAITPYEKAINNALTRPVSQTTFDALVSWCYNVGTNAVRHATVIVYCNMDKDLDVCANALLMWDIPNAIVGRRQKEAKLLRFGTYVNDVNIILVTDTNGHGQEINARTMYMDNYLKDVASTTTTKTTPTQGWWALVLSLWNRLQWR